MTLQGSRVGKEAALAGHSPRWWAARREKRLRTLTP